MLIIYADGSCRGNPGPMAIGVSIQDNEADGVEIETISTLIGDGTNNIAEYRAAIEGLRRAYELGAKDVELRMDSELVIKQIEGIYKVRNKALKPLHAAVMVWLRSFNSYRLKHVPRDDNARADELANQAYGPQGDEI